MKSDLGRFSVLFNPPMDWSCLVSVNPVPGQFNIIRQKHFCSVLFSPHHLISWESFFFFYLPIFLFWATWLWSHSPLVHISLLILPSSKIISWCPLLLLKLHLFFSLWRRTRAQMFRLQKNISFCKMFLTKIFKQVTINIYNSQILKYN